MGFTTVSPLLGFDVSLPLQALQWVPITSEIASLFEKSLIVICITSQMDCCGDDNLVRPQLRREEQCCQDPQTTFSKVMKIVHYAPRIQLHDLRQSRHSRPLPPSRRKPKIQDPKDRLQPISTLKHSPWPAIYPTLFDGYPNWT